MTRLELTARGLSWRAEQFREEGETLRLHGDVRRYADDYAADLRKLGERP